MKDHGISVVVYDWYWVNGKGVTLNHAIDSFIMDKSHSGLNYSILWANHTDTPTSLAQFDEITDYWISNYFKNQKYKTIKNKPVVVIFSPESLENHARQFGQTTKSLLNRARNKAYSAGLN